MYFRIFHFKRTKKEYFWTKTGFNALRMLWILIFLAKWNVAMVVSWLLNLFNIMVPLLETLQWLSIIFKIKIQSFHHGCRYLLVLSVISLSRFLIVSPCGSLCYSHTGLSIGPAILLFLVAIAFVDAVSSTWNALSGFLYLLGPY